MGAGMTTREPYRAQRIGNMRERVTLQEATTTTDGFGGTIETWQDVAEVWARVEPVKSTEAIVAGGIANIDDVLVHIRHRDDVAPTWRLVWQGGTYSITGVRNLDERKRTLTIDATAMNP